MAERRSVAADVVGSTPTSRPNLLLTDSFRFWRAMVVMMGPSFVGKIMALEFYSRHRKECEAGRRKDFRSGSSKNLQWL